MMMIYGEMIARVLLIIGGLLHLFNGFKKKMGLKSMMLIAIGVAALYVGWKRDYYLPFLGQCVVPITQGQKPLMGLRTFKLTGIPANTTVIYWAANASKDGHKDPFLAYGDYANSGVTMSDSKGDAKAEIVCPGSYNVNKFGVMKKRIQQHIHYRYELPMKGMYSSVQTKFIEC